MISVWEITERMLNTLTISKPIPWKREIQIFKMGL